MKHRRQVTLFLLLSLFASQVTWATQVAQAQVRRLVERVQGRIPVVSAGGIMTPEDAKSRLDMGATLVQVYTGLIYRGPGLVKEIVEYLAK